MMSHITEIESMAKHLSHIGAPVTPMQVMAKVISTLPFNLHLPTINFENLISAWDSVPAVDRTMATLTSRLLKEEALKTR